MCRKLIVTNKLSLGNRELGWETYSLPKGELVEFTSKQLKDIIRNGGSDEVYGLKLSEKTGELVFDEAFFTTNIMNKLHINTLVPMVEDDCLANLFYIVIGTHKVKQETMYDVISSRYERASFNAEKVKTLLEMKIISGGAKLENGEIVVAPLEKPKPEEPKPLAGKDLFDRIKQEAESEAKQENEPVLEEPKKVDEKPVAAEVEKQDPVKPEEKKVPEEATSQEKGTLPGKKK